MDLTINSDHIPYSLSTHHILDVGLWFCVDSHFHLVFIPALWRKFYYIDFIQRKSKISLNYYERKVPNDEIGHLSWKNTLPCFQQESKVFFLIWISLCWQKGSKFNTILWFGKFCFAQRWISKRMVPYPQIFLAVLVNGLTVEITQMSIHTWMHA